MAFTAAQLASYLNASNESDHETSQVIRNGDHFQVKLSVEGYEPKDLLVNLVDERYLIVSGHTEEKGKIPGVGLLSKQFNRKYILPGEVNVKNVTCIYSKDKFLIITVPKISISERKPVMVAIPIKMEGVD